MASGARPGRRLEFWYEFASTYSYLSVMRIESLALSAGVDIVWRPFLLGPIFAAQGWTTSPFNIYPAKGRYMVRDIARIAKSRGLAFQMPTIFPANGLQAARLALSREDECWIAEFSKRVYHAQFARGEDIAARGVLEAILADLGRDPAAMFEAAASAQIKARLKANTDRAIALGIFGAPSFVTGDGELFWGDDRLEQALSWPVRERQPAP